jgi:hypothetical protein
MASNLLCWRFPSGKRYRRDAERISTCSLKGLRVRVKPHLGNNRGGMQSESQPVHYHNQRPCWERYAFYAHYQRIIIILYVILNSLVGESRQHARSIERSKRSTSVAIHLHWKCPWLSSWCITILKFKTNQQLLFNLSYSHSCQLCFKWSRIIIHLGLVPMTSVHELLLLAVLTLVSLSSANRNSTSSGAWSSPLRPNSGNGSEDRPSPAGGKTAYRYLLPSCSTWTAPA